MEDGINARMVVALQADISQLRRAFAEAGKAADGALLGIENRTKRSKERLNENLEMIRLTQQLDVARLAGNSRLVSKLSEEVMLRKTINTLTSQGVKAEEARGIAQSHVHALEKARGSREGVGGALISTFDRTRLTVFEEAGAKIPIFGGALEKIGPAGLVAAAGVAAFAFSLEQAHKAMEWSEELEHLAKRLGVTTTELQEVQFAGLKLGISQEILAEGIQKVSQAVGAYTSNVKDTRVKSIFEALGISKTDARNFDGTLDGLEKIADGLAKIQDHSQQLALAKGLKVPDEMVPLLLEGGNKLREMVQEAHRLGVVMDGETVEKTAKLAEQAKIAGAVIGTELRQAFVDLAPVVLQIVNLMGRMANFAAATVENLRFGGDISKYSLHHLEQDDAGAKAQMAANAKAKQNSSRGPLSGTGVDWLGSAAYDRAKSYSDQLAPVLAAKRASEAKFEAEQKEKLKGNAHALAPEKAAKTKKAKEDQTADFDAKVKEGLDAAIKATADAYKALATSVDAKAQFERAALNADTDEKLTKLAKEEADIRKSKVDKHQKEQIALVEKTMAEVQNAALAKSELIERQRIVGLIQEAMAAARQDQSIRDASLQREQDRFSQLASLTGVISERNDFERKALEAAQQRERDRADAEIQLAMAELALADTYTKMVAALKHLGSANDARNALPGQQGLQTQALDQKQLSPWAAWAKEGVDASHNVGASLQSEAVKGINTFNSGITDAIVNAKSMGQVISAVFKQMEASLISYLLKQGEIALLGDGSKGSTGGAIGSIFSAVLGSFGGHAAGTDSSPGGWKMVGENGPELMNVRPGAGVISNSNLAALTRMPSLAGGASVTVIQPHYNDFNGAVMTSDLMAQMDRKSAEAAQAGAALGHQRTMARLQQKSRNSLSR
jgi:hypothetical protein